MPDFPRLESERLILREITDADASDLFRIHGDAEHMAFFGTDPLNSPEDARNLVTTFAGWRTQANPGTRWAMELKNRPGLIGTCGLFAWNRGWKKCTTGYELAPEHTGKGLMHEALTIIYAWGFQHMSLNRIEAQVHEHNEASRQLLSRLGFVEEGRLRQVAFWAGRHHDLLQYSLLASEWRGAA